MNTKLHEKVTFEKMTTFIEQMERGINNAQFERRINGTIVRAYFNVHDTQVPYVRAYSLELADDDNESRTLRKYSFSRAEYVHEIIQDFKDSIKYYRLHGVDW